MKKYKTQIDEYILENLLNRMSKNYVNMLLSIEDPNDNEAFFKKYFDIVS